MLEPSTAHGLPAESWFQNPVRATRRIGRYGERASRLAEEQQGPSEVCLDLVSMGSRGGFGGADSWLPTGWSLPFAVWRLESDMFKDIIAEDSKVQKTSEKKWENTIPVTSSFLAEHLHTISDRHYEEKIHGMDIATQKTDGGRGHEVSG